MRRPGAIPIPAHLLLIGLDAVEPTVFDDRPSDFETLATFRREGSHGVLESHSDLMTDTVWPELRTGRSAARTGIYFQPRQFTSGEVRARARRADELAPESSYWNLAARAGLRVAAVDHPLSPADPHGGAVEVVEWGTHDRPGFGTDVDDGPIGALIARHGAHPVEDCDSLNDGTPEGRRILFGRLQEGIERRTALLVDLLESEDWDLFGAVFSEGHCAGHQLWPGSSAMSGADDGLVRDVYRTLDRAVGTVAAAAGPRATVVAYSSHGMSPADHGGFLVPDVLARLGLVTGNRRRRSLAASVPNWMRGPVGKLLGTGTLQKVGLTSDRGFVGGAQAVPLPNSRHGAIRLRIQGRDPGGMIRVGSPEHRRIVEQIRAGFASLRTVDGDEPVLREVVVVDDVLGSERHPDLPDLVVRFRTDIGPIGPCRSASLGTIHPIRRGHRTGEHGTPGAIWTTGPNVAAGQDLENVRTVDLAPSVLALLGVERPSDVDGEPIDGIVG